MSRKRPVISSSSEDNISDANDSPELNPFSREYAGSSSDYFEDEEERYVRQRESRRGRRGSRQYSGRGRNIQRKRARDDLDEDDSGIVERPKRGRVSRGKGGFAGKGGRGTERSSTATSNSDDSREGTSSNKRSSAARSRSKRGNRKGRIEEAHFSRGYGRASRAMSRGTWRGIYHAFDNRIGEEDDRYVSDDEFSYGDSKGYSYDFVELKKKLKKSSEDLLKVKGGKNTYCRMDWDDCYKSSQVEVSSTRRQKNTDYTDERFVSMDGKLIGRRDKLRQDHDIDFLKKRKEDIANKGAEKLYYEEKKLERNSKRKQMIWLSRFNSQAYFPWRTLNLKLPLLRYVNRLCELHELLGPKGVKKRRLHPEFDYYGPADIASEREGIRVKLGDTMDAIIHMLKEIERSRLDWCARVCHYKPFNYQNMPRKALSSANIEEESHIMDFDVISDKLGGTEYFRELIRRIGGSGDDPKFTIEPKDIWGTITKARGGRRVYSLSFVGMTMLTRKSQLFSGRLIKLPHIEWDSEDVKGIFVPNEDLKRMMNKSYKLKDVLSVPKKEMVGPFDMRALRHDYRKYRKYREELETGIPRKRNNLLYALGGKKTSKQMLGEYLELIHNKGTPFEEPQSERSPFPFLVNVVKDESDKSGLAVYCPPAKKNKPSKTAGTTAVVFKPPRGSMVLFPTSVFRKYFSESANIRNFITNCKDIVEVNSCLTNKICANRYAPPLRFYGGMNVLCRGSSPHNSCNMVFSKFWFDPKLKHYDSNRPYIHCVGDCEHEGCPIRYHCIIYWEPFETSENVRIYFIRDDSPGRQYMVHSPEFHRLNREGVENKTIATIISEWVNKIDSGSTKDRYLLVDEHERPRYRDHPMTNFKHCIDTFIVPAYLEEDEEILPIFMEKIGDKIRLKSGPLMDENNPLFEESNDMVKEVSYVFCDIAGESDIDEFLKLKPNGKPEFARDDDDDEDSPLVTSSSGSHTVNSRENSGSFNGGEERLSESGAQDKQNGDHALSGNGNSGDGMNDENEREQDKEPVERIIAEQVGGKAVVIKLQRLEKDPSLQRYFLEHAIVRTEEVEMQNQRSDYMDFEELLQEGNSPKNNIEGEKNEGDNGQSAENDAENHNDGIGDNPEALVEEIAGNIETEREDKERGYHSNTTQLLLDEGAEEWEENEAGGESWPNGSPIFDSKGRDDSGATTSKRSLFDQAQGSPIISQYSDDIGFVGPVTNYQNSAAAISTFSGSSPSGVESGSVAGSIIDHNPFIEDSQEQQSLPVETLENKDRPRYPSGTAVIHSYEANVPVTMDKSIETKSRGSKLDEISKRLSEKAGTGRGIVLNEENFIEEPLGVFDDLSSHLSQLPVPLHKFLCYHFRVSKYDPEEAITLKENLRRGRVDDGVNLAKEVSVPEEYKEWDSSIVEEHVFVERKLQAICDQYGMDVEKDDVHSEEYMAELSSTVDAKELSLTRKIRTKDGKRSGTDVAFNIEHDVYNHRFYRANMWKDQMERYRNGYPSCGSLNELSLQQMESTNWPNPCHPLMDKRRGDDRKPDIDFLEDWPEKTHYMSLFRGKMNAQEIKEITKQAREEGKFPAGFRIIRNSSVKEVVWQEACWLERLEKLWKGDYEYLVYTSYGSDCSLAELWTSMEAEKLFSDFVNCEHDISTPVLDVIMAILSSKFPEIGGLKSQKAFRARNNRINVGNKEKICQIVQINKTVTSVDGVKSVVFDHFGVLTNFPTGPNAKRDKESFTLLEFLSEGKVPEIDMTSTIQFIMALTRNQHDSKAIRIKRMAVYQSPSIGSGVMSIAHTLNLLYNKMNTRHLRVVEDGLIGYHRLKRSLLKCIETGEFESFLFEPSIVCEKEAANLGSYKIFKGSRRITKAWLDFTIQYESSCYSDCRMMFPNGYDSMLSCVFCLRPYHKQCCPIEFDTYETLIGTGESGQVEQEPTCFICYDCAIGDFSLRPDTIKGGNNYFKLSLLDMENMAKQTNPDTLLDSPTGDAEGYCKIPTDCILSMLRCALYGDPLAPKAIDSYINNVVCLHGCRHGPVIVENYLCAALLSSDTKGLVNQKGVINSDFMDSKLLLLAKTVKRCLTGGNRLIFVLIELEKGHYVLSFIYPRTGKITTWDPVCSYDDAIGYKRMANISNSVGLLCQLANKLIPSGRQKTRWVCCVDNYYPTCDSVHMSAGAVIDWVECITSGLNPFLSGDDCFKNSLLHIVRYEVSNCVSPSARTTLFVSEDIHSKDYEDGQMNRCWRPTSDGDDIVLEQASVGHLFDK